MLKDRPEHPPAQTHGTSKFSPPATEVMPKLEEDENKHWWWSGAKNQYNQPILRWSPDTNIPRAAFVVVRLIYEGNNERLGRKFVLMNVCGWSACCNPDHWERRQRRPPGVWVDIGSGEMVFRTLKQIKEAEKVRIKAHERRKRHT